MIKIFNVTLPEITQTWLNEKYVQTNDADISIDEFLQSRPPDEPVFRSTVQKCCNFYLGKEAYQNTKYRISGRMIYPPQGFMEWHTNGDWPGLRTYASWSETGDSGMMFCDENGQTTIDKDSPGWNIRSFHCPVWHAVWSRCWRVSIGWHMGEKPLEMENMV